MSHQNRFLDFRLSDSCSLFVLVALCILSPLRDFDLYLMSVTLFRPPQRSIRPQVVTTFELPGCHDMWTVISEKKDVEVRCSLVLSKLNNSSLKLSVLWRWSPFPVLI